MKGDGHHGGELLLAEKGTIAQRKLALEIGSYWTYILYWRASYMCHHH